MAANERVMNFVAACFGAGVVTFLGLLIGVPHLGALPALGIALLVGGIVGYFGYEFHAVRRAMVVAARETIPDAITCATQRVVRVVDFAFLIIGGFAWSIAHRPFMLPALGSAYAGIKVLDWMLSHRPAHLVGIDALMGVCISVMFGMLVFVMGTVAQAAFLYAAYSTPDGVKKWHARLNELPCTYHLDVHGAYTELNDLGGQRRCLSNRLHPFAVISWRDAFALVWEATRVIALAAVLGLARGIVATLTGVLYRAPIAFVRLIVRTIILVHSRDRLIVMVNGPVG